MESKRLKAFQFTDAQRALLCAIINSEGTGQHPMADESTLDHFGARYAFECVEKALTHARQFISHDSSEFRTELMRQVQSLHDALLGGAS